MANTTFTTPGEDRYFEDYVPNTIHEFGPISVEQDELNFLTESELSKKAAFESLAANEHFNDGSMMRLLTDYYLPDAGNLSFPEIDEIHWSVRHVPVDKLMLRVTVTGSMRSNSEPDRGIVNSFIEVQNQNRVIVMSMRMKNILYCLPK
jgi:hypothetical protein